MIGIPKVMIFFFIILSTIMFWTTSNVCRYNFVVEKRTNQLNILAAEIDPSIPMARVFYFKELNCKKADLTFDILRMMENIEVISVMFYQYITTDITGKPLGDT